MHWGAQVTHDGDLLKHGALQDTLQHHMAPPASVVQLMSSCLGATQEQRNPGQAGSATGRTMQVHGCRLVLQSGAVRRRTSSKLLQVLSARALARRSAILMAPLLVANAKTWQSMGWKSATVMTCTHQRC